MSSAPCPFCGCDVLLTTWRAHTHTTETVRECCTTCGACGPTVEIDKRADDETARQAAESAMALWEKRA